MASKGGLNLKRIFCLMLAISILGSFTACGNSNSSNIGNSNQSSNEAESAKGTRTDPYTMEDAVIINDIINPIKEDAPFTLTVQVDEVYSVEDGIALMADAGYGENDYDCIPAAKVTFSVSGDFQESFMPDMVFDFAILDNRMTPSLWQPTADLRDVSYLGNIYTGVEYTVYLYNDYDKDAKMGNNPDYIILSYILGENREETYIALDVADN